MRRLDLTGRTDIPVAEEVISELQARARRAGLELLLIGAAARDLVVHAPLDTSTSRATLDVDVAVALTGPGDYAEFCSGLPRLQTEHKFEVLGIEVDVVPFGAIEDVRTAHFSDGHDLDVNGLSEALGTAVDVRLPGGTEVRVASLPAQAALKILAWRDRHLDTKKDGADLAEILAASAEGPYEADTWEDEAALEATDTDIVLAGPYRAGCLAAAPFDQESGTAVLEVLEDPALHEQLVRDMRGGILAGEQLDAFARGFSSGLAP